MKYNPGELEKRAEELVKARSVGERLTSSVITIALLGEEVYRLRDHLSEPSTLLYLVLFALVGGLVFLWQHATDKELRLFFRWFNGNYHPPSSDRQLLMILCIAAVLIGMLFAARSPMLFGCVFSGYNLVVLLATDHLNGHIRTALDDSRVALRGDLEGSDVSAAAAYAEALDLIEKYFLGPAQKSRHVWIFVVGLVGLSLGALGSVTASPFLRQVAYLIFILDVAVSEGVLAVWRIRRDEQLDRIRRKVVVTQPEPGA